MLVLFSIVLLISILDRTKGFAPPSSLSSSSSSSSLLSAAIVRKNTDNCVNKRRRSSNNNFRLGLLSDNNNNDNNEDEEEDDFSFEEDDELSKLIGRRDLIKSSRSAVSSPESLENPPTTTTSTSADISATGEEEDGNTQNLMSTTENEVNNNNNITNNTFDLDVDSYDPFEMPEFKTKRPEIKRKSSEDDNNNDKDDEMTTQQDDKFIDYQVDYPDENDFHIPNRMGIGTASWGDETRGFKSGSKLKKKEIRAGRYLAGDLQLAYNTLLESGVTFVETSESYGIKLRNSKLSAEQIVAQCMEENSNMDALIASTMSGGTWSSLLFHKEAGLRFGKMAIVHALERSCERLGMSSVELYQVPSTFFYLGLRGSIADGLAMAMDKGLCNYVGVCNMGQRGMRSFAKKLERRGCSLTSNQFAFSLTNRGAYKSGLISTCKDLGIIPIARVPLDRGLASGIYTSTNPSGGQASGVFPYDIKVLNKWQSLHTMIETVQSKVQARLEKERREDMNRRKQFRGPPPKFNTDVTTSQIALNYVVAKGCVPLPEISNAQQAEEVLGCLGWGLTNEEVAMLDRGAELSEKGMND